MSIFGFLRVVALTVLTAAFTGAAYPALAHPNNITENVPQNRALLSAVVALGGGSDQFSAASFRKALGNDDEEQRLRAAFGAGTLDRSDTVFSFVVKDAVSMLKRQGVILPKAKPNAKDRKAVAVALYRAGLRDDVFNIERLLDVLFSPSIHMHAMLAVGRMYGERGETAYHSVLARLIADLGSGP